MEKAGENARGAADLIRYSGVTMLSITATDPVIGAPQHGRQSSHGDVRAVRRPPHAPSGLPKWSLHTTLQSVPMHHDAPGMPALRRYGSAPADELGMLRRSTYRHHLTGRNHHDGKGHLYAVHLGRRHRRDRPRLALPVFR